MRKRYKWERGFLFDKSGPPNYPDTDLKRRIFLPDGITITQAYEIECECDNAVKQALAAGEINTMKQAREVHWLMVGERKKAQAKKNINNGKESRN